MARSLLIGLISVSVALTATADAADGVAAPCTGPGCVGDGYGQAGAGQGGFHKFWDRCHVDFNRNNAWPEPFLTADKVAVRTPWCIQTDNGWKMQNTIGTFLFDRDTQQ